MTQTQHTPPQSSAPKAAVRVARIDPKVMKWVALGAVLLTVMMFSALVLHGMLMSNRIHLWQP